VSCDFPHPSIAQNWGQNGSAFLKISQNNFSGSKNAGSERMTHSLPAEDLALLTVVISAWQS